MNYGITPQGFNLKRFEDIKKEIYDELHKRWPDLTTDDESVVGQLVNVFAFSHAEEWEELQKIYLSQSIYSAEGVALDDLAVNMGFYRLPATSSVVDLILSTNQDDEVLIPANTIFGNLNSQFSLTNEQIIRKSGENRLAFWLDAEKNPDNKIYGVSIAGIEYEAQYIDGKTLSDLIGEIFNKISLSNKNLVDNILILRDDLGLNAIPYTKDSYGNNKDSWTDWDWGVISSATCTEKGKITVPAFSIDTIITPVSGLIKVQNPFNALLGRAKETDYEFRLRIQEDTSSFGAATLPAITSRILKEVENVSSVIGYENATNLEDLEGRPPHSFELIIIGGDDQIIAEKIWKLKPAGIETVGNVSKIIEDINGHSHLVKFSRPTPIPFWLCIDIWEDPEELFPTNGIELIRENVYNYILSMKPGQDAYPVRFHPAILSVSGIANIEVKFSLDGMLFDLNHISVPGSSYLSTSNDAEHIVIVRN